MDGQSAGSDLVKGGASVKSFSKHALFFQHGDPYQGVYIIISGIVKLYRNGPFGRQIVIRIVHAGESFAEGPMVKGEPNRRYLLSARALEDTRALFLPIKIIDELVESRPGIYKAFMQSMGNGIERVLDHFEAVGLLSVPGRLILYLLNHAIFDDKINGKIVDLSVSKKTLAGYLGTVPETLSRAFRQLLDEGMISYEGSRIVIVDPGRMRKILHGEEKI